MLFTRRVPIPSEHIQMKFSVVVEYKLRALHATLGLKKKVLQKLSHALSQQVLACAGKLAVEYSSIYWGCYVISLDYRPYSSITNRVVCLHSN